MSFVEENIKTESEILNVEDILANFFLKKINMKGSRSEIDKRNKKKSKHKKHKSKKSKHKSSRRSESSERGNSNSLSIGCTRSSEEKDIKRLQRLKKLDVRDPSKFNTFLPVPLPAPNISPTNKDFAQNSACASEKTDIPYGPSLELLLTGTEVTEEKVDLKSNILSIDQGDESSNHLVDSISANPCSDLGMLNKSLTTPNALVLNSKELEASKLLETGNERKEYKEGGLLNDVETPKNKVLNTSKQLIDVSELKCFNADNVVKKPEFSDGKRKKPKDKSLSRSRSRSKTRKRKHSRSRSKSSHSRSKERSYTRSHSKSRHSSKTRRSRSRNRLKRSRRSRSRSLRRRRRSRSWSRDYKKSKYDSKRRSRSIGRRYRSRSRSRERWSHQSRRETSYRKRNSSSERESKSKQTSRSKSKEKYSSTKTCKIDQAKIREIAEKNVLNMIQQGTMPEGISIEQFKKKELVSIKAGGKSVQELTDFCAKLSKKENEVNDEVPNNSDVSNLEGENDFIHHPFKLKEQSVIKLNIKNAVQIPIKTHAEKFAETAKLSSQFPVSSGNQHKQKELEWIPVVPEESRSGTANEIKSIVPLKSGTSVVKTVTPKTIENATSTLTVQSVSCDIPSIPLPSHQPLPPPPLPPSLPPPPAPPFQLLSSNVTSQTPEVSAPCTKISTPQSVSYPPLSLTSTLTGTTCNSSQISSTEVARPLYNNRTTSASTSQFDFPTLFSKKFHAEQKLQEDPHNAEALKIIQETEAALQDWVNSCKVPGMFYGSTHVKPLPRDQLGGLKDYRVKRDTFSRAAPVTEGKGMSLLKKMGWNPGEGLGKNKEGSLVPLIIDIKMDKKGLVSEGESGKNNVMNAVKELQGKHPVSALMELCSKRKWKPPLYTVIKDAGPPHKKQFLFKVEVNGVDYQPVMPSSNKKVAKADAAIVCLQSLKVFTT